MLLNSRHNRPVPFITVGRWRPPPRSASLFSGHYPFPNVEPNHRCSEPREKICSVAGVALGGAWAGSIQKTRHAALPGSAVGQTRPVVLKHQQSTLGGLNLGLSLDPKTTDMTGNGETRQGSCDRQPTCARASFLLPISTPMAGE